MIKYQSKITKYQKYRNKKRTKAKVILTKLSIKFMLLKLELLLRPMELNKCRIKISILLNLLLLNQIRKECKAM